MSIRNQLIIATICLLIILMSGVLLFEFTDIEIFRSVFMSTIPLLLIKNPKFISDYFKSDSTARLLGWLTVIIIFIQVFLFHSGFLWYWIINN